MPSPVQPPIASQNVITNSNSHPRSSRIIVFWDPIDAPLDLLQRLPGSVDVLVAIAAADTHRVTTLPSIEVKAFILRLPAATETGARQKIAYRFAIDHGYSHVIYCRGAEGLERFPELLDDSALSAQVALSRRRNPTTLGAKTLALMMRRLWVDFPVSARVYSTQFLSEIPFEINSNDGRFDIEILLQVLYRSTDVHIIETEVSDQVQRKSAMPSTTAVVVSALQFHAHRFGFFCSLKYRDLRPIKYGNKTTMLYSSHRMALDIVRRLGPRRILDIGCGAGYLARSCKEAIGAEVTGIDQFEPLPGYLDHFIQADLTVDDLPVDADIFDLILMMDILEHLQRPESILLDLRNRTGSGKCGLPNVLISTPNVAFIGIRLSLLFGRFNYAERGILDITHCRLFTRRSLATLLRNCGYEVIQISYVPVPFEAVLNNRLGRILTIVGRLLTRIWPCGFAFQFLVRCRPLPGLKQTLGAAVMPVSHGDN